MESASRIVERTLGQNNSNIDILRNYKNDESMRDGTDNQILAVDAVYEDDSVRSRPVMSLQCSPHYSELFLAAYGAKGQSKGGKGSLGGAGDFDSTPGMVAVWSQMVRYFNHSYSLLTSYCFITLSSSFMTLPFSLPLPHPPPLPLLTS